VINNFASQVSAWVKKAEKETVDEYRVRTLVLWRDLAILTPRITGVLRSNWQFGAGQTNNEKHPSGEGASASRASAANATLKLDQDAIIFNNMEYAKAVNDGLGPGNRTPRRMVEQAIAMSKNRKSVGR
jgi:hypothetical protein